MQTQIEIKNKIIELEDRLRANERWRNEKLHKLEKLAYIESIKKREDETITIAEAMEKYSLTRPTLFESITSGKLPAFKNSNNRYRILIDDIEVWLYSRRKV